MIELLRYTPDLIHWGMAMRVRHTAGEVMELVTRRGGSVIDELQGLPLTGTTKISVCCQDGHQWQTDPRRLRLGVWCPTCTFPSEGLVRQFLEVALNTSLPAGQPDLLRGSGGPQSRYIVDGFCPVTRIAFEYHGSQHFDDVDYFHSRGRSLEQQKARDLHVRQRCVATGVRLIEIPPLPSGITPELLVDHCRPIVEAALNCTLDDALVAAAIAAPFSTSKLAQMHQLAQSKGGTCLATKYMGAAAKYTWRCAEGHEWQAPWSAVNHAETWCKTCAGLDSPSFDLIQQTAQERGGVCLSPPEEYTRNTSKLLWRCAAGHEWRAQWAAVKLGGWCPTCAGKASPTFTAIQAKAAEHGGACLSAPEDYQHALKTKLRWQCVEGHTWEANWNRIRAGHWCPQCSRARWIALRRSGAFGGTKKTLQ